MGLSNTTRSLFNQQYITYLTMIRTRGVKQHNWLVVFTNLGSPARNFYLALATSRHLSEGYRYDYRNRTPFYIITATAIFPEEEGYVETPNGIKKKKINSLTEHISFSYNMRYHFVFSWTWDGYKFFSTVALCLYLLQGTPEQAFLGMVIVPLECFPQFLSMSIHFLQCNCEQEFIFTLIFV